MPSFDTSVAQLREELEGAGLGPKAERIAAAFKPCVRWTTVPTPDAVIPLGATKIGGAPDVPDDFVWPAYSEKPLSFLGQFDLAEMQSFPAARDLPPSGLLSFFYEADEQPWGFDPKDRGCSFVLWMPEGSPLVRKSLPNHVFEPCRLELTESVSMPNWDSETIFDLLSSEEQDVYMEFVQDRTTGTSEHQLFGHPHPVQNNSMEEQCALSTSGIYNGNGDWLKDERAQAVRESASGWRLLLQLDSDDNAEMMWGDSGMLYFWIRDEDLRARNFGATWLVLQCY